MPTYDYEHTGEVYCDLGKVFERFEPITAQPLIACPTCSAPIQRRISGGAGLIFKGSGFYITDYKGTSKPEKPVDAKPSEHKPADPAKATEPKTYSKPSSNQTS